MMIFMTANILIIFEIQFDLQEKSYETEGTSADSA